MKFGITTEVDQTASKQLICINRISEELKLFFSGKEYGSDLQELFISLICIKPLKELESFFKVKKPRYIDYKQSKNPFTGETVTINKYFNYDIKLNEEQYEEFINFPEQKCRHFLAALIIESLKNLNDLPKKVKDFDKTAFEADLTNYLTD